MKIQVVNRSTKKPVVNTKIQLQVKGRDSGYLSYTTDANGYFQLDDKYSGQQIAYFLQGSTPSQWVSASDGAMLSVDTTQTVTGKEKTRDTF